MRNVFTFLTKPPTNFAIIELTEDEKEELKETIHLINEKQCQKICVFNKKKWYSTRQVIRQAKSKKI